MIFHVKYVTQVFFGWGNTVKQGEVDFRAVTLGVVRRHLPIAMTPVVKTTNPDQFHETK